MTGLHTLVGAGIPERLLVRSSPPRVVGLDLHLPQVLEGRVRYRRVDLTEPAADRTLAEILEREGCDALLHAAFLAEPRPDREYAHELEVIGSMQVMNAVAASHVRKLVVMSTAEVYGPHPDNPHFLSEEREVRPHPEAHAMRDRAEMEELLRRFALRHPDRVVTWLRPCWVMGPRVRSQATRHFSPGRVTTVLGYDPLLQLLHEEDLLDAVEQVLARDAPGAFNLAGDGVLPLSTLIRLAGKRPRPLPRGLLYRLACLPALQRTGDPPAAFYDCLRFLWVVDTARATREIGFAPRYSSKEAWMSFVLSRRLRRYR